MNRTGLLIAMAALVAPAPAYATGKTPPKDHKVTICHNGHSITVDYHALPAHQAHGDTLGACVYRPEPTPVPSPVPTPEATPVPTPVAPVAPVPPAPTPVAPVATPRAPVDLKPDTKPRERKPNVRKREGRIDRPQVVETSRATDRAPVIASGKLPYTGADWRLLAGLGLLVLSTGLAVRAWRATR